MTAEVDIANQALGLIGTRTQISSLTEQSPEANAANLFIDSLRRQLLRMAPWNCATNINALALVCAAPGTPENPTGGTAQWQKGQPVTVYPPESATAEPVWVAKK